MKPGIETSIQPPVKRRGRNAIDSTPLHQKYVVQMSFESLVEWVKNNNSINKRISLVIHPDANGLIITDNMGNIRTEKGIQGYQLNTGEIIRM